MHTRYIAGKAVPAIGLGCMNLNHAYGVPPSRSNAQSLLETAFELGVRHFDTAAIYGLGANEKLVGEILKPYRSEIFLASKCGMSRVGAETRIDGRPATLRATLSNALKSLQTDFIDLYYLHRLDPEVPIEDSVGELARMVADGKIGAIGLSEVSAQTLRRANKVHSIAALETEYSPWSRNAEIDVLNACSELDITFVAFSPLARGFLTDVVVDPSTLPEADFRRGMPRFLAPHYAINMALRDHFGVLAKQAGCTRAQLCLAWLLAKGNNILPIPGTTSVAHLRENLASMQVQLSPDLISEIDRSINQTTVSGERYPAFLQRYVDTENF